MRVISLALLGLGLLASACTSRSGRSADDTTHSALPANGELPPAQSADWQAIVRLEGEAKALVDSTGCAQAGECRSAPVGSRACGGPRYYLVYCSRTTDSVALFKKLAEVSAAEEAYNRKYQIASTCEFRMPPAVASTGGSCHATQGAP